MAASRPVFGGADELSYHDSSAGLGTPAMEGGNTELEMGDVDGHGHVDIVSVGDHGSPFVNTNEHGLMIWFGDGAGSWSVVQNGNFGYGGIALGDVNGDGHLDVGYGVHHDWSGDDFGDQLLEVALGDGTGLAWTPWDDGLATNGESWGMFGTDFADVDGDGDLDVGSISFGCCAGLHVYTNAGDGTWTQSFGFIDGNARPEFVFDDVDGDGDVDFAAGHGDGTVYRGDGAGGFTLIDANLPGDSWRRGVSLGDVDDDGAADVAFAENAGVEVWSYDQDSGRWTSRSGILATIGAFDLTQIADMNLDGHGDVLLFRENLVRVYTGDGAGGWTLASSIDLPAGCDTAAFRAGVDVDHNGYPDFVLVHEEVCGYGGGANRPRLYAESSVPEASFATTARPRPGEVVHAGSVRFVDWHAGVPPGTDPGTVTVALSRTGPGGPWTQLASDLPNNGRYQWHVPAHQTSCDDCRIRITVATDPPAEAITPGAFTIIGVDLVGDLTGDGVVGFADLLIVLAEWGPCPPKGECPADLDGSGVVDFNDLLIVLAGWG